MFQTIPFVHLYVGVETIYSGEGIVRLADPHFIEYYFTIDYWLKQP